MATAATTKKILTIDDEEAIVELIVDILESNNYQALSATKWTDAIDVLSHADPDLILLDLKMPTIHGTSMLEFIRKEGIETPVIVVSGFVTESVTGELYQQGAHGVVKKPFKAKALIEEIERVLSQSAPKQPAEPEKPTSQSAMDALYNRAVDALNGGPAEPLSNDATTTDSNPANDILKALQKVTPESNEKSADSENESPAAGLLEALQKREADQAASKPPADAPPPVTRPQVPPTASDPRAPLGATKPFDELTSDKPPASDKAPNPPSKAPPEMEENPLVAPPTPDRTPNKLGGPTDPFRKKRNRRPAPPPRNPGSRKNLLVMVGITVVCIVVAGFLAGMQYLASEAPSMVGQLKVQAQSQMKQQVNKEIQKVQQQQQQMLNKGRGK